MLAALALASALAASGRPAQAQAEAQAAAKPPVSIAVLVSSRNDVCYDSGATAAIRRLAGQEQDRINRQGGVGGRQLRLQVLDDQSDPQKTIAGLGSALADPQTLAIVGLANSQRGKAAFDALGKDIRERAIPFVSDLSVTSLFEAYPSVFTTRASQDDERLPVLVAFMRHNEVKRPAFIGLKGMLFSTSLGEGLRRALGAGGLAADHLLQLRDDKLDAGELAQVIADLKEKQPDFIVLSIGANRTAPVLRQLMAAATVPPVLVSGRLDAIPADTAKAYPNDLYQLAWDGLPEVYNDRLRKLVARGAPEEWVFEGRKIPAAPGWGKGECTPRPENAAPDPFEAANMRAIATGTQFADMVALIAAAARTAAPNADIRQLRSHIARELATTYAAGRGAFKGSFDNWSFEPASRAASRTPFVVMRPRGLDRTQLAPVQFVRLKNEVLRRIDTLYLDIDLIRAHRIDDNEKTFFAEFYLSMRDGKSASIEQIEFTNALLDPKTNDRQLTVRVLHSGGKSDVYPDNMRIYQISGKFLFEPQLASYPFDTQRFSIDLQPKRGDAPFIIQPPPHQLRDKQVTTDGWDVKDQYVGFDEDFVPVIDAQTHAPSVVPFYKASFVWLMRRQTTDYFLRVAVPLAFILLVAYLSIFIPQNHFEAIITLQVTALLSAVALYLSLPKLDADTATLSDRIFVIDYMLVSLMIGLSILRIGGFVRARPMLNGALALVHIVLIPLMVAAMAYYIYAASLAEG